MSKAASIAQFTMAALGAVVCPATFIGLYDYCDRTPEFEFAPQIMGFLIGMAVAIPWSFVVLSVFLHMLANDGDETASGEAPRPHGLRWLAIPLAAAIYAAIGLVLFRGQYIDNTVFYLASRFAPYFFALLLCTFAAMWIANVRKAELRAGSRETIRDLAPFAAIAVVWAEKLAFGRISSLDVLFAPAFAAILAAVAALRIRKGRAQASPGS